MGGLSFFFYKRKKKKKAARPRSALEPAGSAVPLKGDVCAGDLCTLPARPGSAAAQETPLRSHRRQLPPNMLLQNTETLHWELGESGRKRRRIEGSPASPTSWGGSGAPAEHPQGGGPLLVPGEGLLDGSGHLVPISGVWLGAAQHLPSNPSSDFASHGRAGILGPRGVFWASLPKEIAVWQWVLVQGQGSQAVGLLPSCPEVSAINTMCSSSLYG